MPVDYTTADWVDNPVEVEFTVKTSKLRLPRGITDAQFSFTKDPREGWVFGSTLTLEDGAAPWAHGEHPVTYTVVDVLGRDFLRGPHPVVVEDGLMHLRPAVLRTRPANGQALRVRLWR